MAPKRKASSSNPASSSKPVKKGGPKSRPEGYWPKKNKPAPKKARVEVEYEESSSSKKNGKKGPQPTIAKPKPKLKPVAPPKQAEPAKKKGADKGGKQLTFADESVPYVSPFADEDDLVQTTTPKPKKPKAPLPTGPRTFQIVAGSYEKLLYGLQGVFPEDGKSHEFALKPVFIFPAHQACVKTVAASEGGKWLATGSTDEVVKIWDLRRRKEVGGLINHNGTITSLHFPSRSHLLTTSEDSTLSLFRTRDWTLLRSFKGHVGRVNSITVHPSGKLALTVGKDRVLRMWDLMKGKPGGGVKIGKEGESIRFSPSGDQFAILSTTTLDIYTKAMSLVQTVVNPKRFHDFEFVDVEGEGGKTRELMVAAVEEGYVRVFERFERATKAEKAKEAEEEEDTMEDEWKEIARLGGHSNRVKSLSVLYPLVSTASSDGFINLYNISQLPSTPAPAEVPVILPVTKYDTNGTRLTCLTMSEGVRLSAEGGEGEVVDSESESESEGEELEGSEGEELEGSEGEELEGEEEEEEEEEDEMEEE